MDYPISVPSVGLVGGKFVDEDPVAGTPGSLIPSAWGNAVTDEILNVIIEAGLTPTEGDNDQLKEAIAALIAAHTTAQQATQPEAVAGTNNTKWMSPLRVFQAIAAVVVQATETVFGWAKVATQAQTNAGTDDATFVTPQKLRFGFDISMSGIGYIVFPSWLGGLVIQWGFNTGLAGAAKTLTFPLVWPNALRSITGVAQGTSTTSISVVFDNTTLSTSSIQFRANNSANATIAQGIYWLAIGN